MKENRLSLSYNKGTQKILYILIILMTMCPIYTDDVSYKKTPLAKLEGFLLICAIKI